MIDVCNIQVMKPLLAEHGFHFSKEELMSRMEARVGLPVINVMEDAT